MSIPNPTELRDILRNTRTVAVVGASDNPGRPSNDVFGYLLRHSRFELYPVNPNTGAIGGIQSLRSLSELPVIPDMVAVFRRREDLPGVLDEVLRLSPLPKYLWLQQGLRHDQVAERARSAGMTVVMDRCLKVDYARIGRG